MEKDLQIQDLLATNNGKVTSGANKVVKAVLILTFAALALWQVAIQVEEYLSHPSQTLYTMETADKIQTPAFTFCPKPSVRSSPQGADDLSIDLSAQGSRSRNTTMAEDFKNVSVSLLDVLNFSPIRLRDGKKTIEEKVTSVKGETVHVLDSGTWRERTFSLAHEGNVINLRGPYYYKCFTLLPERRVVAGSVSCSSTSFLLDFRQINTAFTSTPLIEMYIHDRKEKFTFLSMTSAKLLLLRNNTMTSIFSRPEIIHRQSRMKDPCIPDEDYSYSRCMEICFWERFYSSPGVPCVVPSLLPVEATITKPECKNADSEMNHTRRLWEARREPLVSQLLNDCDCTKRCDTIEYHIFPDPTSICQSMREGIAMLHFNFPSKLVPHILEKELLTSRDLLVSIGGIVGIFLCVSLLTIAAIDLICCGICFKLCPRRNEVIDFGKQ
ncbi:unnamed protein product [Darwinula stevensoni]|uniref:Uncharacterized protein n=1 Tax=Darwinula stevensoni TaxID=69355 RepID=A0A7R9AF06_9CRUS|nr:unnamed protein product [Darwinula stevensoni]CAG0901898.1 unnamed protein product [Darwinula stevensoni]